MRLLVELGYHKYLLPEGIDAAAILQALSGAVQVEEKNREDYTQPKQYARCKSQQAFEAPQFIHDSQLIDDEKAAELDTAELTKRNAKLHQDNHAMRTELDALKAKVAELLPEKKS